MLHRYIISSGFSTKCCGAHIFPNHFCGSIHHPPPNVYICFVFFCFHKHKHTYPFRNLSVCKVLCGCAIILTRVILFSSSYVNVDVLSAFHVSHLHVVAVATVAVCVLFFSLSSRFLSLMLAAARLHPSSLCEDFICKN